MKFFVTILLILSTLVLAFFASIQTDTFDFLNEFKPKSTLKADSPLFEQDLRTTAEITITGGDFPEHHFSYELETGLWHGSTPWVDRADGPKVINQLVLFALNTTVVDSLEVRSSKLAKYGFGKDSTNVVFRNSLGEVTADFSIGKTSAWKQKLEGEEELLIPTIYLRKNDSEHPNRLYLCTDLSGNVHKYFKNQLKSFRDHRPFALNINTLKQVRLVRSKTEIVLSHETPKAAWKLKKPLELNTERKAVMEFLANLSKLEAIALHEKDSVALPENQEDTLEISVTPFHSSEEVTLTRYPAASGSSSCYATVSNRDVVFELPLIATSKVSNYITQLPKSINELRSRTMLHLSKSDRADLRSLIIRTPKSSAEPCIIARIPGERYKLITQNDLKSPIDETVLVDLLKQLTTAKVKNFAGDATTDFTPFGLDDPFTIIDLVFFSQKPQQLRLGKVSLMIPEKKLVDAYYANLRGTPIVWEIDSSFAASIPTRSWDWLPKTIWNLPVIDITSFTAQRTGKEKLTVHYNYLEDTFSATMGEKDMSAQLRPQRAKFYLNENHLLVAQKRLNPSHKQAIEAFKTPTFTTSITVQEYDDEGLPKEPSTHTLQIAKASKTGASSFYYARSSDTTGYFILSLDTVRKLAATDLFDEE